MASLRTLRCLLVVLLVAGGIALAPASPARAASFTVDNPFDLPDADLTDGLCVAASGGGCTLRAAIQQANALGGLHSVTFAAGGTYDLTRVDPGADTEAAFGDLDIVSGARITITGAAAPTVINAAPLGDEMFRVFAGGALTLRNLDLMGGKPGLGSGKPGAITNIGTLMLENVTVRDNEAQNCGAIANAGGTATITTSTLRNNLAHRSGGALCNGFFGSGGTLAIVNSTIADNRLDMDSGVIGNGAGLFAASGDATITGSTIARNLGLAGSTASVYGGGLAASGGANVTLTNSTVSDNNATSGAGGIYVSGATMTLANVTVAGNVEGIVPASGTIFVRNTLLAGNGGANCVTGLSITSQDYNLSDDASCAAFLTQPHDLNSTPARLGALGRNGGPTETRSPLAGSAAIDAIPAPGNGSPIADQRGVARPQGARFDIGAVEYTPPAPLPPRAPSGPPSGPPLPLPAPRPPAAPAGPPAPLPNPRP